MRRQESNGKVATKMNVLWVLNPTFRISLPLLVVLESNETVRNDEGMKEEQKSGLRRETSSEVAFHDDATHSAPSILPAGEHEQNFVRILRQKESIQDHL